MDEQRISAYLSGIAHELELRAYDSATIHATAGVGKADNQGYDAFMPLIDSGISLYVWSKQKFFASLLFTCKTFNDEDAVAFTKKYFEATDIEFMRF